MLLGLFGSHQGGNGVSKVMQSRLASQSQSCVYIAQYTREEQLCEVNLVNAIRLRRHNIMQSKPFHVKHIANSKHED